MANKCVICNKTVDHSALRTDSEHYNELCERADMCGMEALTENEQCLVDMFVCSDTCFEALD